MKFANNRWAVFILLGILFLLSGCASCRSWNDLFDRDAKAGYGWHSGDGAYTVELPGQRILWLFGDSLVSDRDGPAQMVRNSIAVHPAGLDGSPPDKETMRFYARDENGRVVDITYRKNIPSRQLRAWAGPSGWLWPGDGIMIGDTLVIFYSQMDCTQGRPPRCASEWSWEKVGTYVLIVDNPREDVRHWNISLQKTGLGKETWGCALYYAAPYLYVFGVDEQFEGRFAKYRVDGSNARRFADWTPLGVTDHIAKNLPTEFSVDRVTVQGQPSYVLVHQKLVMSYDAVVRMACSLDCWPDDVSGPSVEIEDLRTKDRDAIDGKLIWAVKAHAELTDPCLCTVNEGGRPPGSDCMLISYYSQHIQRLRFMCYPFSKIEPYCSVPDCSRRRTARE